LPMRTACQLGLLVKRSEQTLSTCATFLQRHPDDLAGMPIAIASGALAEDLFAWSEARDAYSHALLTGLRQGMPATDVLVSRCRANVALGALDDARRDLQMYMNDHPQLSVEAKALAKRLAVDVSPQR
jgi:hypothetical protein